MIPADKGDPLFGIDLDIYIDMTSVTTPSEILSATEILLKNELISVAARQRLLALAQKTCEEMTREAEDKRLKELTYYETISAEPI